MTLSYCLECGYAPCKCRYEYSSYTLSKKLATLIAIIKTMSPEEIEVALLNIKQQQLKTNKL